MKLAILSDTHGLLRPEVMERLKDAGAILHGGDINRQSILDQLEEYAPLYVVRGNNDKEWAERPWNVSDHRVGNHRYWQQHRTGKRIIFRPQGLL